MANRRSVFHSFTAYASLRSVALLFGNHADVNAIATGRSFRPLNGNSDNSENMFIRKEADGTVYLAAFNYTDSNLTFALPLQRMGISTPQSITELWSHKNISKDEKITIPQKDVMIFKLK